MKTVIWIAAGTLALTACANTGADYRPIVDGPVSASYSTDLAACQAVAKKRSYLNDDTKGDGVLGAAIGAVLGAFDGNIVEGAIVGGVSGLGAGAYKAKDERKDVVVDCMRGRGHKVVG
ncbi:glycine zipper family protein [Kordiimonas sp.]|uniref:glycine zipper family protein n=1 Tax=Kordiimonas sp. TaxID=1970157 RepID=UPI003A9501A8